MDLELDPPHSVGPLRLGTTRSEATAAFDQLRVAGALSASDSPGVRVVRPSGLMVSIDCMHDRLHAVELWRPASSDDTVHFRGVDVFNLPARTVVEQLRRYIAIDQDESDSASYSAPELVLSLWRPFAADDEPQEEQGYYFSSVLIAATGYYDTPAQAAERTSRVADTNK